MAAPRSDTTSTSTAGLPVSASTTPLPEGVDDGTAAPLLRARPKQELRRFRDYTYWSLVTVSAFMLVMLAVTGNVPYPPATPGVVLFAGLAVVIVAIARLAQQRIPRDPRHRPLSARAYQAWAAIGVLAAVVVSTVWVVHEEPWLWTIAPAAVISLLVAGLPKARRSVAIAAVVAGAAAVGAVIGAIRGEPTMVYLLMPTLATAFWLSVTLASAWTWDVVVQLDEARRTASSLAVANERLRFAADLHDIQGHSLQVIALKGELASRLATADPTAAAAEMEAVRQLAVDALRDTREVVEGYRRTSLDTEIANASNVLGSDRIDTRLHLDDTLDLAALPQPVRDLLGLVVREAVTNVLRHSTATEADIELRADRVTSRVRLVVRNDGAEPAGSSGSGGGLSQLANRLHEAGGRLSWDRRGDRFEIRADLPIAIVDDDEDEDDEPRGGDRHGRPAAPGAADEQDRP